LITQKLKPSIRKLKLKWSINLKKDLKAPFVDIDEIRYGLFKNPSKEMEREQDRFQMATSYNALFWITNFLMENGDSLVIAATFSRKENQQRLIDICKNNQFSLKVIYCYTPDRVILERIFQREKNEESHSTCRTWEHYERDKLRYEIFPFPKLEIDTSRPVKDCLKEIIFYINLNDTA